MYCVICGILLADGNREGLVCQECKQERRENRRIKEPICVQYCFACGQPYCPTDASIRHRSCTEPELIGNVFTLLFRKPEAS